MKSHSSSQSAHRATPDRRKLILYATLGALAIALVVTVAILSRNPTVVPQSATESHPQSTIKVGQIAPNFAVSTTAGPFDLAQTKSPVFLEVFATWCPHCQRETKILNDLYAKFGKRVEFVAVSGSAAGMDGTTPESQGDVFGFVQKFAVKYPVAFDADLKVAESYLQSGFPTMVVIRADKKISAITSGEQPESKLASAINGAL